MFVKNTKHDNAVQDFLIKLSNKNLFSKKDNRPTTQLAQTEEEQRRYHIKTEVMEALHGFTSFYNLNQFQTVKDLINTYRQLEFIPEVSDAINQIVDECLSLTSEKPVMLDLSRNKFLNLDNDLKVNLYREFDNVLKLLDFYNTSTDLMKQFFIDGRLYFENIFDPTNLKEGIVGVTLLNPKVVEFFYDEANKLYFSYIPSLELSETALGQESQMVSALYTEENLTFVHSGIWDIRRETILGFLHPALKEAMRLALIEDASVVYRLVRAPERRVYEVDTGKLPPKQAEEYVRKLAEEFRAKKVYDPTTGQLVSNQAYMTMLEDIWLPKSSDGRGTTVSNLEGGQNLGEIADIEYFQKKLFKALKIPRKRMDPESTYTYISGSEINYEEYQFLKHVQKIRQRFSYLFVDLMRKNCILKGILNRENFDKLHLNFIWETDSKFDEVNSTELLQKRITMLESINGYIGTYFSEQWVKKNVLKMTEVESDAMMQQIANEKEKREQLDLPEQPDTEGGSAGSPMTPMERKLNGNIKNNTRSERTFRTVKAIT